MRRLSIRALMALSGLALLLLYLSAAVVGYRLLLVIWAQRPDPMRVALYFVVVTVVVGVVSYRFGTAGLLTELDAAELTDVDAPWLHRQVELMCAELEIGRPTLYLARMDAPNALALGTTHGGAVVLDYGLFQLLTVEELEAVIAHELAHLESNDGLVQTVGYTAVRTASGLLYLALLPVGFLVGGIARALALLRGDHPGPFFAHLNAVRFRLIALVVVLLSGLTLALRAHSRRREFAADDRAVELTGNPIALARALVKIERATTPGWGLLSPLYIHGDEEGSLSRLLATHPPMRDRVERLLDRADSLSGTRRRHRRS